MSEAVALQTRHNSVLIRMGERFGVDPGKLYTTLKATAFKGDVSNEQFLALMIVADQYKLNPLTKEIYAFPDKNNGIVPVVGVDGWSRILNEHPQFDGVEFADGPIKDGLPEWIECKIFRKDRQHPTIVREYMAECRRSTGPWGSHPRRLLRHKSLIQAARMAMGFVGIYDQDEAERIVEGSATLLPIDAPSTIADLNAEIAPSRKKKIAPPAARETSAGDPAAGQPQTISDDRPPLELDGVAMPGPTYPEVRTMIEDAKKFQDPDALALAVSLIASLPPQFQAELRELAAKEN